MGEVINFGNPDEVPPTRQQEAAAKCDDFIGKEIDWIKLANNDEITDAKINNAINLFWIGANSLMMDSDYCVPSMLRKIADEIEWQIEHGEGPPDDATEG